MKKVIDVTPTKYEIVTVENGFEYYRYSPKMWTYTYADIEHEVDDDEVEEFEQAYQKYMENREEV